MTTNPFNHLIDTAKEQGLIVKEFCSFCPNASSGSLEMEIEPGQWIKLPVCEPCVLGVQESYSDKFDTDS